MGFQSVSETLIRRSRLTAFGQPRQPRAKGQPHSSVNRFVIMIARCQAFAPRVASGRGTAAMLACLLLKAGDVDLQCLRWGGFLMSMV